MLSCIVQWCIAKSIGFRGWCGGKCSWQECGTPPRFILLTEIYVLLVTFQKTVKEFSPSIMYADYPISMEFLHWESQANTAQHHTDGQNLIHHQERGYTILVFASDQKRRNNVNCIDFKTPIGIFTSTPIGVLL